MSLPLAGKLRAGKSTVLSRNAETITVWDRHLAGPIDRLEAPSRLSRTLRSDFVPNLKHPGKR